MKKNKLLKWAGGVVGTVTDMALVEMFYGMELVNTDGKMWLAMEKAEKDLARVNAESLARAIRHLRKKGLVQTVKEKRVLPRITAQGKVRVKALIPSYDSKRLWDGRIYLITYDVARARNKKRDDLRRFLRQIGCGRLQDSVWMTPYNPKELIKEFVAEKKLFEDMILVSSLGQDGAVGEMEIKELVEQVYKLTSLNARWEEFIAEARTGKLQGDQLAWKYWMILDDDPQLPFTLLPDDWKGEEAQEIFLRWQKIRRNDK